MRPQLSDQVVVLTGASSGIGRATAHRFAEAGSSIVLAARDEAALEETAQEVRERGGTATVVVTDVADWDQVAALAEQAIETYGRIDTWVNDAAVSSYGRVVDLPPDEIEQVIRVDLLGQVFGMKAAADRMVEQGHGAIINVASMLGVRSVPLLAPYCASKHGVIGFAESLRVELGDADVDVSVSTVLPGSIDTPLFDHAASHMETQPAPPPPIYPPDEVARAIVACAERPRRQVFVGGAAKMTEVLQRISPRLLDVLMRSPGGAFSSQKSDRPAPGDNLFEPEPGTDEVRGQFSDRAMSRSLYTRMALAPGRAAAAAVTAVAAGAAVLGLRRRRTGA